MTSRENRNLQPRSDINLKIEATPDAVNDVNRALNIDDMPTVHMIINSLHATEAVNLLQQLPPLQRHNLLYIMGAEFDPEIIFLLPDALQNECLQCIGYRSFAKNIQGLESNKITEIISSLDKESQIVILQYISPLERELHEQRITFKENTAGRIMSEEVICIPATWTIKKSMDYLRQTKDLPDTFQELILVDLGQHPIGVLRLDQILQHNLQIQLCDIMEKPPVLISSNTKKSELAPLFQKYDLVSVTVVNQRNQVIGVITVDDVMSILSKENEKNILHLAGVKESDIFDSIMSTMRNRFKWLFVNLLTAIIASVVINIFDETLEQAIVLAILMPIIASMAGNAGTQTMIVAVRALSSKSLTAANAYRIVLKEVIIGGINGLLFALILGTVGLLWFQSLTLGYILAIAMVINLIIASFFGTMIPIMLTRMKLDPAVSGTVFLTTITDVTGFFSFLGLGYFFLVHPG